MSPIVQLGVKAVQQNDLAAALAWFRQAHAQSQDDPVARAWLGQTLFSTGQQRQGIEHLVAAAGRFIHNAQAAQAAAPGLKNYSHAHEVIHQLQAAGAYEQALPLAREVTRLDPASARGQQLLAVTCGQLNLTPEALRAVQAAERLAPKDLMLQVLHASLEADHKQYDAACDRLEALLQKGIGPRAVGVREAFRAFKELARCLDALGEHGVVFAQLEAAASLAPTLPEYQRLDKQLVPNNLAQARAGFSRDSMARFAGQAFPEQPRAPVFLMGFFRSGTTLTQEVLAAHPKVFVADEANLLRAAELELQRLDPGPDPLPAKLARLSHAGATRLRAAYWAAVQGRYGADADAAVFVDKFTLNTVDLGLINTIFPDAQALFVMRDPRDVCLSCVMQLMSPSAATLHLLTLADTAALYAQVLDWWVHIQGQLSLAWLEFRYEDAVSDFEGTFKRVFAFLGLDWHAEVQNFHLRAAGRYVASPSRNQVAQPLYSSSVQRWRLYERELAPVQAVLAPFVARFGYDPA